MSIKFSTDIEAGASVSIIEYKNITITILNTGVVEVGLYSVLKRAWLWTGRIMARMYFTS